ncbi:MAG: hypothetical protein JWL73_1605 [Actinomycetia bacterium]|nr:hypothetical protein [Actinomycetes bacterium]
MATSAPQAGAYARTAAYVPVVPAQVGPEAMVAEEARSGRAARIALLVALFGQIAQTLASVSQLHRTLRVVDQMLSSNNGNLPNNTVNPALGLVSNLGSLAVVVCGVLFIIWAYRSAKTARGLGIHGPWGPGWFIGGWFIPIANLVIPYLCIKSLLPPDAPGRRTVRLWWAFYVAQYVLSTAAIGIAWVLYQNNRPLGAWPWIPAGLSVVCVVGAARYGRVMIDTIVDAHRRVAAGAPTAG